jgi:hypothetical protein
MSSHSRHRGAAADGRRGPFGTLSRQWRYLAAIVAVAMAFGSAVALTTHGSSHAATIGSAPHKGAVKAASPAPNKGVIKAASTAANDDGIKWVPGTIDQVGSPDCAVEMNGSRWDGPSDMSVDTKVDAALHSLPGLPIGADGITNDTFNFPAPQVSTTNPVDIQSLVKCNLTTITAAAPLSNPSDAGAFDPSTEAVAFSSHGAVLMKHGVVVASYQYSANSVQTAKKLPKWLRGAVGAIAGAVVYVAVSAIVVGAMVAFGAATGPGGVLASAPLAALAGCIGGAIATAATIAIATDVTLKSGFAAGVAGCLTGSLTAGLPIGKLGAWLATAVRNALGVNPAPIVGSAIVSAARSAGVSLTPIQQAMQAGLSGLPH